MAVIGAENRYACPWQQMIIDLTGEVVPCCYWSGYGNTGKPLGNTNTSSIDENARPSPLALLFDLVR